MICEKGKKCQKKKTSDEKEKLKAIWGGGTVKIKEVLARREVSVGGAGQP